jgi:hypothetical protein
MLINLHDVNFRIHEIKLMRRKILIKKNYNCNFLIPYLPCQDQRIYQKATINLI